MNRRQFVRTSAAGAGLAAFSVLPSLRGAESPGNKIIVGVMGTSRNAVGGDGRGTELAKGFANMPNVEVAYICDVDSRNVEAAIQSVVTKTKQKTPPKGTGDFRRILDDKLVDALIIATPDHWHAPAAILACAAGKHVYVEKPCSHNPREGEMLVAAARKHKRLVQHGTQRRSWPAMIEAVQRLRSGEIGRVLYAKCCYYAQRPTIGKGNEAPVPDWLDYSLWQGPAPERPYRDNVVHYNWHWFWHWGTGEIGNNGVHTIDVARWGLDVDFPSFAASSGLRLRYEDDQETPDTHIASFDFDDTVIAWEGRSCFGRTDAEAEYDVAFYGEKGSLVIQGASYKILDPEGKQVGSGSSSGGDAPHIQNFLAAIRQGAQLNAEIAEGHISTLLCHLGNIACRTGRSLRLDPMNHQIADDPEAMHLWSREYRLGWEPKV